MSSEADAAGCPGTDGVSVVTTVAGDRPQLDDDDRPIVRTPSGAGMTDYTFSSSNM